MKVVTDVIDSMYIHRANITFFKKYSFSENLIFFMMMKIILIFKNYFGIKCNYFKSMLCCSPDVYTVPNLNVFNLLNHGGINIPP